MNKLAPLAALLLAVALVASSHAQGAIDLVKTSAETRFPQEILFRAQARSTAGDIQRITLSYGLGRARGSAYGYLTFDKGREVTGEYSLKTRGSNYIPPGARLRYFYVVEDSAGNRLQTEPQTVTYEDTRFQWSQVNRGLVTVRYYGNGQAAAQHILQAALVTNERASQIAGVAVTEPVTILVYNSKADMDPALPFRSETTQRELITLGEAHSEFDLLLVLGLGSAESVAETTAHEFMHLITHQATDNPFSEVPAWLNEGLSVYAQGNVSETDSYLQALRGAIKERRTPPLRSLVNRPGRPPAEIEFYGQSYSVVKWLVETYGPAKMKTLLATIKQGKTIDEALQVTYGLDLDTVDNQWRESMGLPALPTPAPGAIRPGQPQAVPTLVPFGVTPQAAPAEKGGAAPAPATTQQPSGSPLVLLGAIAVGIGVLLLGAVGGAIVWLARKTRG